jgi:hypothetical protein
MGLDHYGGAPAEVRDRRQASISGILTRQRRPNDSLGASPFASPCKRHRFHPEIIQHGFAEGDARVRLRRPER